jgi:hypothetical protein
VPTEEKASPKKQSKFTSIIDQTTSLEEVEVPINILIAKKKILMV